MKYVSEAYNTQLAELAHRNVNFERYGHPAVQACAALNLPMDEIARVYNVTPPNPETQQ